MMDVCSGSLGHTLPALQPPTPAAILGNWPRDVTSWINTPVQGESPSRGRCLIHALLSTRPSEVGQPQDHVQVQMMVSKNRSQLQWRKFSAFILYFSKSTDTTLYITYNDI